MAKSSYLLEMERRANDLLRVYNPTDEDYVVEWDRKNGTKLFRVPAKSEEILPRYIAEKYIKEMYQKIIDEKISESILDENKSRIEKGMQAMNRWDEQLRFEVEKTMTVQNNAGELIATLYVGIDREYGVDREPQIETEPEDNRSPFEKALTQVQEQKDSGVEATPDEKPETEIFKCDFPGCTFTSEHRMGVIGHKRTHRKEVDVMKAKKAQAVAGVSQ